jgi:hypothetical protein
MWLNINYNDKMKKREKSATTKSNPEQSIKLKSRYGITERMDGTRNEASLYAHSGRPI